MGFILQLFMIRKLTTNKLKINNLGFSLFEIIIYIALFALTITLVTFCFLNIKNIYSKTSITINTEESLSRVIDVVSFEVKKAKKINFSLSSLNNDNGLLYLEMKEASTSPEIIKLENSAVYLLNNSSSSMRITGLDAPVSRLFFSRFSSASSSKDAILMNIVIGTSSYNFAATTSITIR